jgi:hypothetical protein
MKKSETIQFKKGIHRINFPVPYAVNFMEEVRKIEKLKLPKHSRIGFNWCEYKLNKNDPGFTHAEVYIEK